MWFRRFVLVSEVSWIGLRSYLPLPFWFLELAFLFSAAPDAGEALSLAAGEAAGAALASADGEATGEGCCEGEACGSGFVDCSTDCEPVKAGRDRDNAINMKAAAAPIVIFDNKLAVPLGPNAVLDKLLEKSAPASALPG